VASARQNRGWRRLFGAQTPARSLTAAGSPLVAPTQSPGAPPTAGSRPNPSVPEAIRARRAQWQLQALEYAEAIPEVAGVAALVRASVENVKLVVGGGNADTRKRIQSRIDALDVERIAELIFLSGESYVAVPADANRSAELTADDMPYSLSVAEFKPKSTDAELDQVKDATGAWVDMPLGHSYMRIWRPSKGNRWQAYSPLKAAMDLLEAMYLHQLGDTALAKSRLAGAGGVFWPTDAESQPLEDDGTPVKGSREEILGSFQTAAWAAISQQNSQEAVIPYVVFYDPGPGGEAAYKPEMFRIERDDHAAQYASRVETHRARLASAIELPAEAVTGIGDTNHWSAWQIDVDKWKTYLKPLVEMIRVQLELRLVKAYGPEYVLEIDATDLIAKPDQTPVIMQLMQLEMVTPDSGKDALVTGDLEKLEMQDPPQRDYKSNSVTSPPSDFKVGGDRGGGKYRDKAPAG